MAKVKFGDVVKEVKNKIDRNNNPYEFYVAGDHMDTDSLSIPRRGSFLTDDVGPAFIREFKKGQVLYGSRRTYLRKVAVADFDGVTANTTFVLETKDENILRQRLLPFIMYTEGFTAWSIKKSRGSTNPYVLFKDLADYEFDMPSIEEQDKLAEVLWSINDTLQAYQNLLAETDALVQAQFVEMFGLQHKNATFIRLEECCQKISGGSTPSMKHPEYYGGTIPFVKSGDIKSSIVDSGSLWLTEKALEETRVRLVPKGAVIIVIRSAILQRELPLAVSTKSFAINQDLKALEPKEEFDSFYLYWAIKSKENELLKNVQSMLTSHLDLQTILNIPIMDVPLKKQLVFRAFVEQGEKSKSTLQNTITSLQATRRRILEDALGTGRKE